MKIELIPAHTLKPYENNPRIHSDKQIKKLMASIQEYGIVLPVLIDADNLIIAGHAIVTAAQNLNISEIPCVRASHLNEAQKRAYILADNRLAEDSEWDKNLLKSEMLSLRDNFGLDLEFTGFESREIVNLRMDVADLPKDEDSAPELENFAVSQLGDIWQLGENRIICGDCTDSDTVNKLLAGAKPHIMITDPPYGVNYNPKWRNNIAHVVRTGRVLNDDIDDWRDAWKLFPGDVAYIWHASLHGERVAESLRACGFVIRSQIVWAKPKFALSRGDYHWQHECCLYALRGENECPAGYCPGYDSCWYAVRDGEKSHWQGSRSESTLWEINFNEDTTTTHGTQKPVECMRRPMLNNSDINEIIYEPFSGSGTTIIAAESCHRRCYAIELSPEYVDMAVKRWQEYTGRSAILEGTEHTFDEITKLRVMNNA